MSGTAKSFLMFPGQGSQYPGMGADWAKNFREANQAFEEASDGCGLDLRKLCFDGTDTDLKATEITQPAILTTSIAIYRSLAAQFGLGEISSQSLFAGHSLGEYSALVAAGALSLGAAARLVNHRGQYMQQAVPPGKGAMSAIIFRPKTDATELAPRLCEEAQAATKKFVSVANYNSPEQIVISGETEAVTKAGELALTEKYGARKAVPLPVSAPFHCALMKAAADKLAPELAQAAWQSCPVRYIANVDAKTYSLMTLDAAAISVRLKSQITDSVLWTQSVRHAISAGHLRAFEIGPGSVLTGLAKRIEMEGQSLVAQSIDRLEAFKNENIQF